jgi:NAD(P)-dependent dehydrogenase (short-subunit alcohol dehydrogenase family)
MTISFEGRVALVTGAGNGLGRAYALELARRGAKVVVNDLGGDPAGRGEDAAPAQKVVDEIEALGGEAIANLDSVADYDAGMEMVRQAIDKWGRLDIVIANAGILRDRAAHNITEEDWDIIFDVHAKGAFNVVRHAWAQFRVQGYGRVVLTSSSSGIWGNFGQANYGAAKTSLIGFMNVLKQEGVKYNVKVNTLAPVAGTRLTAGVMQADQVEALKPEYVVPATLYMASEDCTDSGMIIEAGAGNFNRAVLMKGPGVQPGLGEPVDLEWVQEHWGEVTSLEGARPMWNNRFSLDEWAAELAKAEQS